MTNKKRKIIITGAGRGLGLETVKLLVAQGDDVVGLDIASPDENTWSSGKFIQCDITDELALERSIEEAVEYLGGVDILINNAGVLALQDSMVEPTLGAKSCFDVNFWGAWKITSKLTPHLLKSKGKIINVSSLFAYVNAPLVPGYATSKRALSAFSDSIRIQYKNQLTVTTVYPGFLNTNIHDDAVRQGLSVAKIVDLDLFGVKLLNLEEPLVAAAKGLVRACSKNFRNVGTTRMGTLTLWFARHVPSLVDFIIAFRVGQMIKKGRLNITLDEPKFR